jgi:phosphatidylglycerophosphatase C
MTALHPHHRGDKPERIPGRHVVAAFDLDGTLTRGGSVWQFLSSIRGRPAVAAAGMALFPKLVRAALVGGSAADEAKEALFVRMLAGFPADEVARQAAAFGMAHYRRRSRTKLRARLDWHRRQGHRVVLVSASPEYYVRAVGDALGVDGVVATRLEVDGDGKLTGRFEGRNCRGEQKLQGLREWMKATSSAPFDGEGAHVGDDDGSRPFLWAYGNSAGDRQMLEAADIGVDAGRLGRFGKLRQFRRLGDVLTAW